MQNLTIPDEVIMSRVYQIRDQKVMFDREVAELYDVETRVLKQAVRRNKDRFPDDFMFELTKEEFADWRSQTVMSKEDRQGMRYPPFRVVTFCDHLIYTYEGLAHATRL